MSKPGNTLSGLGILLFLLIAPLIALRALWRTRHE